MHAIARWSLALAVVACSAPPAPPTLTVTHRARALHPGEVVVVTVTADSALTAVRARDGNRTFPGVRLNGPGIETSDTWQVLLGLDLDTPLGSHTVRIDTESPTGPATTTLQLDVAAKAFATRRLTVDPNFVNPPAEVMPRITEEAVALNALWATVTEPPDAPLRFTAPVPHAANSAFGTRSIFNGEPRSAHGGADFLSPAGTPIAAPAPGTVVLARDLYYTGGTVVIDHGLGLYSLFAHLSAIDAAVGAAVTSGTVVGKVGRTGRVTGAHLHWTVRLNGTRVDPLALVELLPAQ